MYAGQVYSFLLRSVEHETAQELLQDVFLLLWQKAGLYDPQRGSFNAWFFTLIRHRLYDVLRSEYKGKQRQAESSWSAQPEIELIEDKHDLEAEMLKLFRSEEIHQALQTLPPEQRQALVMTYFGGLSQRELAVQLDLPLSTIKGRARLGLARLRQLLPE
jgi:RNA polymerase sigma-70 factor (ECF subfamily)